MTDTDLIDAEALAKHFSVTPETVQRWVRERRVPCVRPSPKVVRFRVADVEQAVSLSHAPSKKQGRPNA